MNTTLLISHSISRGQNTYGYNIISIEDTSTGKRYRTCGGGYDMLGTVVGEWLQKNFQDRLLALKDDAHATYSNGKYHHKHNEDGNPFSGNRGIYGMTFYADENRIALDGACGLSCITAIAQAIGVNFRQFLDARRRIKGFNVEVLEQAKQTA